MTGGGPGTTGTGGGLVVMDCELACGHHTTHKVPVGEVSEADVTGLNELPCVGCAPLRPVARRRLRLARGNDHLLCDETTSQDRAR